jgi:hypothetical protein
MTTWFSASSSFTNLPNSVGLLALPLRITSADGSIFDLSRDELIIEATLRHAAHVALQSSRLLYD